MGESFVVMGVAIKASVEAFAEFLFINSFIVFGVANRDLEFVALERMLRWCIVWFPCMAVRVTSVQ